MRAWYLLRQYDRALEATERTLELDSDFPEGHWLRGMIYTQTGDMDESPRSSSARRNRSPPEVNRPAVWDTVGLGSDGVRTAICRTELQQAPTACSSVG